MQRPLKVLFFSLIVGLPLAASAPAQSPPNQPANQPASQPAPSSQPSQGGVAQQFNSGANQVGHGAADIGEGIKQGAIMVWQSLRDGANAVAARFNGAEANSGHDRGQQLGQPPP
ncbi:MAG TPA: hypothetical protein VMF62_17015 [Acetobacteraceae bacterium]|nr:hypothetical protein [Acetobacteraceae bacterium]